MCQTEARQKDYKLETTKCTKLLEQVVTLKLLKTKKIENVFDF